MSGAERVRLADDWERNIRRKAYYTKRDSYVRVKEEYRKECKQYDEMRDEVSVYVVRLGVHCMAHFAFR